MWETIIAIGLFLFLISWLAYGKATGRWEYKRFLREIESENIHFVPTSATMEGDWLKGEFLRGTVFFNGGIRAFYFRNERAFLRAVGKYNLRVPHSKPMHREGERNGNYVF